MGHSKVSETAQSETGDITRLLLKHPRDAFRDAASVAGQWRALNFTSAPDITAAIAEYDRFVSTLNRNAVTLHFLPESDETTLDSIYVRDASVVCDRGAILCRMTVSLEGEVVAQLFDQDEPDAAFPCFGDQ